MPPFELHQGADRRDIHEATSNHPIAALWEDANSNLLVRPTKQELAGVTLPDLSISCEIELKTIDNPIIPGHQEGVHFQKSDVTAWLDQMNTDALNQPIPKELPNLPIDQQKMAQQAVQDINDILKAQTVHSQQEKPNMELFNTAVHDLQKIFGGSPDSPNFGKPIEFFKQLQDYVNVSLQQQAVDQNQPLRVRLGTSDVTHETYLGFNNSIDPDFKPFVHVGGVADCSQYKG